MLRQLGCQLPPMGLLLQTSGLGGQRIRQAHKTVPTPEAAIQAHQALALRQSRLELRRFGSVDHPDLGQAAMQCRRTGDEIAKRLQEIAENVGIGFAGTEVS